MRKRSSFFSLLLIVPCFFVAVQSVYGQSFNWPMLNYCKERTSWVPNETVLYPPLKEINSYSLPLNPSTISGITFYNNLLCASFNDTPNMLGAFDVVSGDTLWTFQVEGSMASMDISCAQNDSTVFAGGQNGSGIYALDRTTGQPRWHKPVGSLYTRNIILDEDRGYVFGQDSIYCMEIHDGATVWSQGINIQGTPAVDDQYIYAAGKYKVRIYNKWTGELHWDTYNSQSGLSGIAVDTTGFYTVSNDTVYAYAKGTWNIRWSYHKPEITVQIRNQNTFAVSDSVLCFIIRDNGEGNGQLMTLDKATGDSLWVQTFVGIYMYPPVIANGVVYVVSVDEAELYGFHLKTGEQLFHSDAHDYRYQPIVADHKIFVIADETVIVFENEDTDVVPDIVLLPDGFKLEQNYPNPFNPTTTIQFSLEKPEFISLTIYNLLGERVETLMEGYHEAGEYQIDWNAEKYSSGIYLYCLKAGEYAETRKLILQR